MGGVKTPPIFVLSTVGEASPLTSQFDKRKVPLGLAQPIIWSFDTISELPFSELLGMCLL